MLEKQNLSSFVRTHHDILNEYWYEIESLFTSLEADTPNIDLLIKATKWRYCQTSNKKDRKKVGFICRLDWQNGYPFVSITVNHFKLGKSTFDSRTLDKNKKEHSKHANSPKLPKSVIGALRKERQEKQAKQDALEEKERQKRFNTKLDAWKKGSHDIQQHPYAIKKGLVNNDLIRQFNHELIYPLTNTDTGKICGLQTINEKGEKRFFGQQKNAYTLFGNLEKAAFVYLCEGYATANAVLHLVNPHTPFAIINTLNCHNLIPMARWVKKHHAGKKIIFAADNDQGTFNKGYGNVGLWTASKAAMLTQGALIYPTTDEFVNIDWCDAWRDSPEKAMEDFHAHKKQTFKELALNRLAYASQKISDAELFSAVRDVFQVFLSDYPLKLNDDAMIEIVVIALARFSIPTKKIKSIWVSVKKQQFAKALRAKTFSYKPKENDYTVQTFDSMDAIATFVNEMKVQHKKAIFVTNAPMGTGKTNVFMKPNFKEFAERGEKPVIITPTRALTKGVAEKFETSHYQKDKENLSHKTGLAITINSIIHENFESFLQKTNALFIDEYTQVLRSITSGTVKASVRQRTHQQLTDLMGQSAYVFIADADLNQIALDDVKQSVEEGTPIFVMTLEKKENTTPFHVYSCSRSQGKILSIQRLQEAIQQKKSCYVVTDSKKRASVLCEYLKEESISNLLISSDTLKTNQVQDFLSHPDDFLGKEKPQVVIVTPAVQSGISIESDYFQRVLGIYTGTVAPAVFHQMLSRVRKPIQREIILIENIGKTYGNESTDTLLTESYQQYMQQFGEKHTYFDKKTGVSHIGCLSLQLTDKGLLIQGDPLFERFERLSANLKALEHQQKNNALPFFALHLLSDGIDFKAESSVLDEKVKALLSLKEKMAENTALEEHYNTLCGKNYLTTSLYRQCQAKDVNTIEEVHAMKRFEIADTLAIEEVRPSDVDFFDNDGKKVLENYHDLQEGLESAHKKDEIEQQQAVSKQDLSYHASKVKLLTLIFDTLGLDKKTGIGCYHQEKALKVRNCIRQDAVLSRYVLLKLSLSVNSRLSDIAFINKILKKLLRLKAERLLVRENNQRIWFYNVRSSMWSLFKYTHNEVFCEDKKTVCHQK